MYETTSTGDAGLILLSAFLVFFLMFLPVVLVVLVPTIIGLWKTFTKAHQPGWAAIVPIYNIVIWCKVVGRPAWWVLLFFVPILNIVVGLILSIDLAKSFGKDVIFGVLTWLFAPIMLLIIAFNKEIEYKGPLAAGTDMFSGFHNDESAQPTSPFAPQAPTTPPAEGTTIPPVTSETPGVTAQPTPPSEAPDQNKTV